MGFLLASLFGKIVRNICIQKRVSAKRCAFFKILALIHVNYSYIQLIIITFVRLNKQR